MVEKMKDNLRVLETYQVSKDNRSIILDANENPHNIFEFFLEEFIHEIRMFPANRYPNTDSEELREHIAKYTDSKKENIICGNGSDEIIQMVINTFIEKGDSVVIHTPTFSMYKVFTSIAGGAIVEVLSDEAFRIHPEEIISASNKADAKLIFLCNPNNPTGFSLSRENIIMILENTKATVVVDEAYYEFLDETVVDLTFQYERLIVLRTMSKAFALAGARVGYGVACKETMEMIYKVKPPYNLNSFSQLIGRLYLKNMPLVKESILKIKQQRESLLNALSKINELQVFPSAANFVLIRSKKTPEILQAANGAGISLRNYGSDPVLGDCLRITVGTEIENRKLINVIEKVVG